MTEIDADGIREVPCPGPPCDHPPDGHVHLQAEDGCSQIWSRDGELLAVYDLTRPALVPVVTPMPAPRRRGRIG